MARPRTIQNTDLLSAAKEVFIEQGFSATTASIAQRAGVSEGTLFKRFATKEDLFVAAMGLSEYGEWRAILLASSGQGEVRHNLERAALGLLSETDERMKNVVAVFSRGIDPSHNPLLHKLGESGRADVAAFAAYLQAEMRLGRVRLLDVEVAAITLIGALGTYIHSQCLPAPPGAVPAESIEAGRFVQGLLDVVWPGLQP